MTINRISTGILSPHVNEYARTQGTQSAQERTDDRIVTRNKDINKERTASDQSDRVNSQPQPRGPEKGLSEADKKVIAELKAADDRVRAHEMAHVAAGGQYTTSGANFAYKTGPDGKRYAVAGEVGIDISAVPGDPEATAKKMDVVKRAALAPMDPSPQDRRVAARATMVRMEALMELTLLETRKKASEEQVAGNHPNMFGFGIYSAEDGDAETGLTINIMG